MPLRRLCSTVCLLVLSLCVPLLPSLFSLPRARPSPRSAPGLLTWDEPLVDIRRQKASIPLRQLHCLVCFIVALLLLVGVVELARPGPVAHASSGTWSPTGFMSKARVGHTATRLTNGQVLVAGGINGGASAELYDPSTGRWSPTGSMSTGREYHTATLLTNGQVLVAGGDYGGASAELYDPSTGTWSPTGSMSHPRVDHTATLLTNGQVLVAGGSGRRFIRASAELYTP